MSTPECRSRTERRDQWLVPITSIAFGLVFLVVGLAVGRVEFGVTGLVIMLAYAAFLVAFRRRGESAALLAGDLGDERRVMIQQSAAALTGRVLIVAVVAGFFWALITENRYEGVFAALCTLGGVTLMASTVWYSRRG